MKRLYKLILLLLVFTLAFFTKISVARADDNLYCYYSLPFTGIEPNSERYLYPLSSEQLKCYDETRDSYAQDCYMYGRATSVLKLIKTKTVSGNRYYESNNYFISFDFDKTGNVGLESHAILQTLSNVKNASNLMYGATGDSIATNTDNESSVVDFPDNSKAIHINNTKTACPKYIVITKKKNFKYSNKLAELYGGSNNSLVNTSSLYFIAYYASNNDDSYRTFLNSFLGKSNSIANSSDSKYGFTLSNTSALDDIDAMVLPLYDFRCGDTNKNCSEEANDLLIDQQTSIFRETVIKAWINLWNKEIANMETNCGSDWEKYINFNNYKEYMKSGGSKSAKMVNYGRENYDSKKLVKPDSNMNEQCWNARKEFFNAYKTFRVFWYSIGFPTDGNDADITDVDDSGKEEGNKKYIRAFAHDETNLSSSNVVYNYPTLKHLFKTIRYGSDVTLKDADQEVNSDLMNSKMKSGKTYETADYVNSILYKDRCSYKCFGVTSEENLKKNTKKYYQDKYNYCTTYNTSYKDCVSKMKECGGGLYSSYEEKCKNNTGQGYDMCMKTYDTDTSMESGSKFRSCMDGKITDFGSNYDSMKSITETAKETAKDEFDKSSTYKFESAGLLRFDYYFKPYTPNCRDVKFLTIIWNIMIILAPFLLIIYSSFDYFKVVMAGDEEKMKISRKKVPKRIIALVLLLVFPVILRAFVTKFGTNGANNTTYIKCVVTNDKGEKEETEKDSEKNDDNKGENKDEKTKK